ncbi:hypothetical protein NQ117_03075 [Paenibacillus sp. SC116]|uniref:DUF6886 family protein n=1 Tax=Paenibacillus sp. SC116 TaxID=2968986 RepID=UPI00215A1CEB|nr:DUF6886 family protein [Paenibacillus sp. SC116]MCR8842653.1 hypothetical protein [Paenibacillus sp. SC116]
MRLFHFSEEDNIKIFKPRVKANRTNMPPVVWAIDDEHQFTFFFPRNCPRIVYTKNEQVLPRDEARFFGNTTANTIITVETHWYSKIINTTLYRYEFPIESFTLFDATAGYYISHETVKPLHKIAINNGLEQLMDMNVELRFTPNLYLLREQLLKSSIDDFGIHRFEHAVQL